VPGVAAAASGSSKIRFESPVVRFSRLTPPSLRVGENVTPESETRLEIVRSDSLPPGNVGRCAKKFEGK
jgi:hypothetical protein